MAALIALRVLKGFMDGPSPKLDDMLNKQLPMSGEQTLHWHYAKKQKKGECQ